MSRLVYLGTPAFAVPPLRALASAGHDVALVVSQPDKRRGRGGATSASPVKKAATELGIPVTERVTDSTYVGAELGVVVAFGRIIKESVLEQLPLVNMHFSLLPRWRGAAPVERAILAGDADTGVCLMALEPELDTGPVYRSVPLPIRPDETAEELRGEMVRAGTTMLVGALSDGVAGLGEPVPQFGEPTYAAKLSPEELRLRWSEPAELLHRVVRVGGAWAVFRERRLRVLRCALTEGDSRRPPGTLAGDIVATGAGGLRLLEVQLEGKSPVAADAWLRGARPAPGERLG